MGELLAMKGVTRTGEHIDKYIEKTKNDGDGNKVLLRVEHKF